MNIYNKFRGVEKIANKFSLSKRFDEPTYFSFRLYFSDNADYTYNIANNNALYDVMPHPLFSLREERNKILEDVNSYSAIRYLEDANEPTRAEMLRDFILKFNSLQNYFPYYFQQIDGISELIKIDTEKGQRVTKDKKITVTCLEGLDLRMSYLLNLYRKIVWDDVYQRWVLPDMMRYFTLKIYLAEFRTFHMPTFTETGKVNPYSNSVQTVSIDNLMNPTANANRIVGSTRQQTSAEVPVYLKILDDILPTWEIMCEMCEFDISDISFDHLGGLNVAADPVQGAVKFGIKIGNIKELQTYPVFQHRFLSDRKLNAINRSKEELSTMLDSNNKYLYPASLQIAQNRTFDEMTHVAGGKPFVERTNEDTTDNMKGIYPSKRPDTFSKATEIESKSGENNSWAGNLVDFGTAYAKNFVNKIVDKTKVTSIPQLGISFSEITAALSAKSVVGAIGLIRKGVNEIVNQYGDGPSSRLEQPIQTDMIMRQFLTELKNMPKTSSTDKTTLELIEAANIVLTDKGTWEKIKDYSLATDMVTSGETNIPKNIQSAEKFSKEAESQLDKFSSELNTTSALQNVDSNAASEEAIDEDIMSRGKASDDLKTSVETGGLDKVTPSSKLSSRVDNTNIPGPKTSERLFSEISESNLEKTVASSKLNENIKQDSVEIKPSSSLQTSISDSNLEKTVASSKLDNNIEKISTEIKPSSSLQTSISDSNLEITTPSSKLAESIDFDSAEIKPSSNLQTNISDSNLEITTASGKLTKNIEYDPTEIKPSSNLQSSISESELIIKNKEKSEIEKSGLKQEEPNIRNKTIDVNDIMEAVPSKFLDEKITQSPLDQPKPSKATNSKLEQSE